MWPTPQDYNEAIQNPRLCFRDADLAEASVVLNSLGLPKPVTGAFASVYQMDNVRGRQFAVRCFLHNIPDQAARYAEIGAELKKLTLPYMVPFEFINDGIHIHGVAYPMLKMHWVNGRGLIEWVQRRLDYPEQIGVLSQKFKSMCAKLRSHGIAHGDLQHGNIIITNDELKLVDYDAMYVPALAGRDSPEIGHRHYQHPHRTAKHYDAELDNFSAWSIYTSLVCLAADPTLWRSLGAGDECLLFRQEDYVGPRDSVAFRLLENHEAVEIQRAARAFRRVCGMKVGEVPGLEVVVEEPAELPVAPLPARMSIGGRNVREAVRIELVVDEDEVSLTTGGGNASVTKVPVQVLPQSKPQRKKDRDLLVFALSVSIPMLTMFVSYAIHSEPPPAPSYKQLTFEDPDESVDTALHRQAIDLLNSAEPYGFRVYRSYIAHIQANLSDANPQQTAYNDLSGLAHYHTYHWRNPDFGLGILELTFDMVKTARGPNSWAPRTQSKILSQILKLSWDNREFAEDTEAAKVFADSYHEAQTTIATNPMQPIEWPAQYRTDPGMVKTKR